MSNILANNINPRSGNRITIGGVNDTVSIGGTLSYEDVTNIDSVGIITARQGIVIGTGASIGNPANNELGFYTDSSERLHISSTGNIGIGSESPTKSLSILSSQSVMLELESTSTTSRIGFKTPDTTQTPTIGALEGNDIQFRAGANERMRIASEGAVSCGSTLGSDGPGTLVCHSASDQGFRLSRNTSRNYLEFVAETAGTSVENHFSIDVPNANIIIYIMMDYVGSRQTSSDAGTSRIGFENFVISRRLDQDVTFGSNYNSLNFEVGGPDAGGANDKQAVNPFMQRTGSEASTATQQVEVQVQPRCSNGSNGWVTSHIRMIVNGTLDYNDFRVIVD